ncbi:semaphorin-5B-like [Pollicipes pollicipes]|uniref:semaphorin-5B-like n=1 Tax=Pollicipes pollicipes TaxID=41117 RepID=UPI001884E1DC|nr:semaphorin-5B-like [Pollicipes pollicipes]
MTSHTWSGMAAVVPTLLLPLLLSAGLAQELDVTDRRVVTYSELQPSLDTFSSPDVTTFSEILFDIQKYQMIVGARDHLFRLSVKGLQELESVHWPPPEKDQKLCEFKGQAAADCHNYVRVLHGRGERLLACGTNAFQPQCSWRQLDSLRTVFSNQSGIAVCPYSPHMNVTSLVTAEGEVVAATPTDFSGLDPAIYRQGGGGVSLRTSKYDSTLLSTPQFVGSFETRDFVYFVFREDAVEYMSCGKRMYSRIARVCKNDRGNRRGTWTTFLKARLNCSVSGEYPFYLDQVQSIHYLDREEVLYATFTTPENGLAGSAVCAFNLSAIGDAFDGPFRRQREPGGAWPRQPLDLRHFQCGTPGQTAGRDRRLADIPQYALAHDAVMPTKTDPLLLADGASLTAIATDVITTKHHVAVHVIFVADKDGTIRKLSVVPRSQKTCLVEVLQPFEKPTKILTMKLLKEEGSLYLGTDSELVRVPVQRCERYQSEDSCLGAMDPYCGWDAARGVCSRPPGRNPDVLSWRQLVTQCPDPSRPVDGGWSGWTDWQECGQAAADGGELCRCRRRSCSSPAPANGGAPCTGLAAQVANCTRHGGWTGWSAWSACSHPCGRASKSRRRSCTNPAPAHGGRPCVGEESQDIFCHSNPPCPSKTNLPLDGGWGGWGSWGRCSARCGGGFRRRRRVCDSPRPVNGGRPCLGCDLEYAECGTEPCPTLRRLQRFRFACRAPVPDAGLIRPGAAKTDERFCSADGLCSPDNWEDLGWGDWSDWSDCSALCGGGVQSRSRLCEEDHAVCQGRQSEERQCNAHSCAGEWTCWSEWSACSGSCGAAQRQRTRRCRSQSAPGQLGTLCDGDATYEETCQLPGCTSLAGWEDWTVWSLCDENNEQHRKRRCKKSERDPSLCQGHDRETRICVHANGELLQLASSGGPGPSSGIGAGMLALGCVLSFVAGALLAAVATYFCFIARWRRARDQTAKLYDTPKLAAANTYVPMGGVRGVSELAEMKNLSRLDGSVKGTLPPSMTIKTNPASIRRSGGNRYDLVSPDELRVDLDSDAIY